MSRFSHPTQPPRVVLDTNIVFSALRFANGRLAWIREHWQSNRCVPLISRATAAELTRVLSYAKFRLKADDMLEMLSAYIPYCETVEPLEKCPINCRDTKDQMFLDLAQSGNANLLVTGDEDMLVLAGQTSFLIETPEAYRRRFFAAEETQ